jgi:mRNA interferase MazF
VIQQGEVWLADLGDLTPPGHEQHGIGRPVLVVSTHLHNAAVRTTAIVTPITSRQRGWPTHVCLPAGTANLRRESAAMVEQLRVIDTRRLSRRIGRISPDLLDEIMSRIRMMFGL